MTTKQQNFIARVGAMAVADMKKNKILASLTIAQAIIESGWGESGLTVNANALFGIKATSSWTGKVYDSKTKECYDGKTYVDTTATFRAYDSWEESVNDHSAFLTGLSRYKAVVGEYDYKKACKAIHDAGYATGPDYGNKLIKLIEQYDLTKFDKEVTDSTSKPTTSTTTTPTTIVEKKATGHSKSFSASVAGTYKVTAAKSLYIRNGAGTTNAPLGTLPKDHKVQCYGYYSTVNGVKWLKIQTTYNNVKYTGFCSNVYLKKV